MEFKKQNNIFCTSEAFILLSKNVLFLYIFKSFYHVTLENIYRILNNSVYFQNIVLGNEP